MPPPAEESKPVESTVNEVDAKLKANQAEVESEGEEDDDDEGEAAETGATGVNTEASEGGSKKKKKSKRKKVKEALTGKTGDKEEDMKKAVQNLTPQQIQEFLALNPALRQEVVDASGSANPTPEQAAQLLKGLDLQDIMTGLAAGGKNVKEMGAYKFWQTQPVPRLGDKTAKEGPLIIQKVEDISTEPAPLPAGFEWVTLDLNDDEEIKEVYELLNGHYVEDDEAMFRFNYSPSFLRWGMMSPGWDRKYHIGVRAKESRKLLAYISAIPAHVRVRENTILASEVNFLVVHKKLRGKRLAPVLIREITRVSNLNGIWQGVHTAGIVLPKPVSTARYFHRSLNWQKLYECGFSPLPRGSSPQMQVRKYKLPEAAATNGLRRMEEKDLDQMMPLYERYSKRFDMAPVFTKDEMRHWFMPKVAEGAEEVVWTYVVEDNGKVTDFFSFNCIESSIIRNSKWDVIRVAYLWYYATESGLKQPYDREAHSKRLNALIHDALILAKGLKFDVFNALSLMDNALFLEKQLFGAGDGQLHYYLFNYSTKAIAGGVKQDNQLDKENLSGIGFVML